MGHLGLFLGMQTLRTGAGYNGEVTVWDACIISEWLVQIPAPPLPLQLPADVHVGR